MVLRELRKQTDLLERQLMILGKMLNVMYDWFNDDKKQHEERLKIFKEKKVTD